MERNGQSWGVRHLSGEQSSPSELRVIGDKRVHTSKVSMEYERG